MQMSLSLATRRTHECPLGALKQGGQGAEGYSLISVCDFLLKDFRPDFLGSTLTQLGLLLHGAVGTKWVSIFITRMTGTRNVPRGTFVLAFALVSAV